MDYYVGPKVMEIQTQSQICGLIKKITIMPPQRLHRKQLFIDICRQIQHFVSLYSDYEENNNPVVVSDVSKWLKVTIQVAYDAQPILRCPLQSSFG